ncbi:hypothetical protein ACJQWK_06819 [Exserohilum turcicum]
MAGLAARLEQHAGLVTRTAQHQCSKAHAALTTALEDAHVSPKAALYAGLALATCLWLLLTWIRHVRRDRTRRNSLTTPSTPNLEKTSPFRAPERPLGVWHPVPFTRPPASPYPNWCITSTPPLPYRPFRHGPKYNITMGLRRMHWDEWIELDNQYLAYHALKASRLASRGPRCVRTAPEAVSASAELLQDLVSYLPQRYPSLFRAEGHSTMRNLATGEVFDAALLQRNGRAEEAIALVARVLQDDVAIMMERPDGQYYLVCGAVLLAGFWRLEDKFGMGLSQIHQSGDVPGYKDKLEKGMMSFFRRIQPDAPMLRNNYFIQVDDKLAWSDSIRSEDASEEGAVGWFTAEKNKAIEHHYFRSERQSLRRLPKSGGVVFTIRTYFEPITKIAEEPYVPGRLASAIRSWGDDVSRYKGKERYGEVLLEYLDRKHAEQVAQGLVVEGGEDEAARGYPF